MKIRGKTAVVTGGNGAIGSAIVRGLASHGVQVLSIDRQSSGEGPSPWVTPVCCEMGDAAALQAVLRDIQAGHAVDILVNCVGISPKLTSGGDKLSLANLSLAEWNALMDVNLASYFLCIQHLMPAMMARGGGRIVNIASHVARNGGNTGAPHYITSKAAILGLTKAAAKEAAPANVTVNAVNPGRIETPMTRDQPADVEREILARIPLGRLGRPEDVAGAVLYLASDLADYVTGAAIEVNGGMYIAP